MKKTALILVLSITISYAQTWDEAIKISASDGATDDFFGVSVSISGDYAIIGASKSDFNNTNDANAAYILKNSAGTWSEIKKLVASDGALNDRFGFSVSISGDYAIVGAFSEDISTATSADGAAYIFGKNEGGTDNWGEVKKITASDANFLDIFGASVSISGDYAIVGASLAGPGFSNTGGAAYIFNKDEGGSNMWGQVSKIVGSDVVADDLFGGSVNISGDYAIVGARAKSGGGAAYIFNKDEGGSNMWGQVQKIVASDAATDDEFGRSVGISDNYAIVGASLEDLDDMMTADNAGAAYVFKNNAGTWSEIKKLVATNRTADDEFGFSVSISGNDVIIGNPFNNGTATDEGTAYIFNKDEGGIDNWGKVDEINASDREASDQFGFSVALSEDYVIVGANLEADDNKGAIYIFEPTTTGDPDDPVDGPEINIKQGDVDIVLGGSFNFGEVTIGTSSELTFDIESNGTEILNIIGTAGELIAVSGENTEQFSLSQANIVSPIASGNSQSFTIQFSPISVGTQKITLTILSNDSDEGTYVIDIKGVGIRGNNEGVLTSLGTLENDTFKFYPNPTQGSLNLKGFSGQVDFVLIDNQGKQMITGVLKNNDDLDLSSLPAGIYTLTLTNQGRTISKKIIKQ